MIRLAILLQAFLFALGAGNIAFADNTPLFAPPRPASQNDEILLLSTREVGTVCLGNRMRDNLQCRRYTIDSRGKATWNHTDWQQEFLDPEETRRTVIYVHGNRIEPGEDRIRGMEIYRSFVALAKPSQSIRFVIWSWPSTPIPGPIKDYQIKAARTQPAGWQLAWFLDQLPKEHKVSVIGYSYGARVVSGAMHLLGGGQLRGLKLSDRVHPQRTPIRVAMVAAAFDADWIQPGRFHGLAMTQIERLVLVTNHLDPVMRFYYFSVGRRRVHALGKKGLTQPQTLGSAVNRVSIVDVTQNVGRSHALFDYLQSNRDMSTVWQNLTDVSYSTPETLPPSFAGVPSGRPR